MSAEVWIEPTSPLLTYSPDRVTAAGSGWILSSNGSMLCSGSQTCTVSLQSSIFSEIAFFFETSPSPDSDSSFGSAFQLSAGLDGTLTPQPPGPASVVLQGQLGNHSASVEAACAGCTADQTLELTGVRLVTEVVPSGTAVNVTLDDTSPAIVYTGFTALPSTPSPSLAPGSSAAVSGSALSARPTTPSLSTQHAYNQSLSLASTAGSAATISFSAAVSAVYIFGCTGPTFGVYTVTIDGAPAGTYNASNTAETYNTLLFFATGLAPASRHQVVLTNQIEGGLLAIDYVVAVTSSTEGTTPPAFPSATSTANQGPTSDHGSTGAIVGGILGALLGLGLLALAYRYYAYRKAGGKGSLGVALCGPAGRTKPESKKAKENKFALWPMIRSRPKYDTN